MENFVSTTAESRKDLYKILNTIGHYLIHLKKKWGIIFFFSLIGGAIGYGYATQSKPIYTAKLTFALEEEKTSGGFSGAMGLASTLGIDLGAGTGGVFSGANIIELMKSRMLVEKTLLTTVIVSNRQITLADYYLDFSGLKKNFNFKKDASGNFFPVGKDTQFFTLEQNSILSTLYGIITNSTSGILSITQKDKKVGILSVETKSTDELFSKLFTENLTRVVSDFYVKTKSKKAEINVSILQKQTDSVRASLNNAISGVAIANENTYNLNQAMTVPKVTGVRRQVDVQANTAILTQLVANLEMAKVALRKETPLIQIIDKPVSPLPKTQVSKMKFVLLGLFGGAFLVVFLFSTILFISDFIKLYKKDNFNS